MNVDSAGTSELSATNVGDWGLAVKVATPTLMESAIEFLMAQGASEGTAREAVYRARNSGWIIVGRDGHVRVLSDCA